VEFEQWFTEKTKQASTLILMVIVTALIVAAVLRHWLPASILYLFLFDIFRQILIYVRGLALLESFTSKYLNTPFELPKQLLILAVVETERHLLQVGRRVFCAAVMPYSRYSTLKERAGATITNYPFLPRNASTTLS
jgi:hypothetical protein